MVSVRINGSESGINAGGLGKFAELIELIKASIDPTHMITSVRVDGQEADDKDWMSNLSQLETSIVEIDTDTPGRFVAARFADAPEAVRSCYIQFRDSRKAFQNGDLAEGNRALVRAVTTAKAFFEWYGTMMQLVPAPQKPLYDIEKPVSEIAESCKKICQQQLYQSWWALGETLEKDLEPKLDKLEDFCRGFRKLAA